MIKQGNDPQKNLRGVPKIEALPGEFSGGKANIMSWCLNGANSIISSGVLADFLKVHQPDVLCLQKTRIAMDTYDANDLASKLPEGYA